MSQMPWWGQGLLFAALVGATVGLSRLLTATAERRFRREVADLGRALQLRVEAETEVIEHMLLVVDDLMSTQPQLAEPLQVTKLDMQQALAKLQADDLVAEALTEGSLVATLNAARAQHRWRRENGTEPTILNVPASVRGIVRDVVRDLSDEDIARIRAGGDLF